MSESALLLTHFASTLLMVGLIWFVQVVHYPLMAAVGAEHFHQYAQRHQSRTTYVVAGPMLVEVLSAACLLFGFPQLRASWAFLSAAVLLVLIWAATACLLVPIHQSLTTGFDERRIRRLIQMNWLRTISWTLRGVLIGGLVWSTAAGSA